MTTQTRTYTAMHSAMTEAARDAGVDPFVVRVIVALAERDGSATTQQVTDDLGCNASQARRAALALYERGFATGQGVDGGRRRAGVPSLVRLTTAGQRVAEIVLGPVAECAA